MARSLRAPALLLVALLALSLCACLPLRLPADAHFPGCTMTVHDADAGPATSALRPYLDEVSTITGMRFRWVATSAEARFGLRIERVALGTAAEVMGSYSETYQGVGGHGEHVVQGSLIRLRPGASAGIRRHELGHLFNLAHNPGSPLMRAAPAGRATFSPAERVQMRAMAERSGCSATVHFGG